MEKASHLWASCWMAVLLATRIMVKTLVATGAARMGAAMTAAFLPNSSTLQIVLQPDMYTVLYRFGSCCLFHDCFAGCLSVLTVGSVCDRVEIAFSSTPSQHSTPHTQARNQPERE